MIEHCKDQNWFAVVLDLVVVVVGIFLAFQVERWYENRRLLSEESVHLVALAEDFAAARKNLAYLTARYAQAKQASAKLLSLDEEVEPNLDNDGFYRLIAAAQLMGSIQPPRQTYDALIATGKIDALGDDALKVALADYFSTLERVLADETAFGNSLRLVWQPFISAHLDRVMMVRYAHPDDTQHLNPTHDPDRFLSLIGSDEFEDAVSARWHYYRDIGNAIGRQLDATKQIEGLIEDNLVRVGGS